VIYEVGSSTIGRAISEIRPLLAERGFAVPDRPGIRLRTLADVFAYAAAENVTLRIDGTETQVRRPKAHCPGRRAFVSGKRRQNTIKTTTISDQQGRTLWSGAVRPGRMHDQTAVRTEGIADQLRQHPMVKAAVDEGYRGLANEFPDQISAPPRKPKDTDNAPLTDLRLLLVVPPTLWNDRERVKAGSGRQVEYGPHLTALAGHLRSATSRAEFTQAGQDIVVPRLRWMGLVAEGQNECLIVLFGEVEADVPATVRHDRGHQLPQQSLQGVRRLQPPLTEPSRHFGEGLPRRPGLRLQRP
jgi:hypothetical protein